MTLATVNLTFSGDRIRGAARQVQSYLEGARSRAVYGGNASGKGAGYQCGVRFIRDANNSNLCTSIQFVEIDPSNAAITGGVYGIRLNNGRPTRLVGTVNHPVKEANTRWYERAQQGLIFSGQVILLNNRQYRISTVPLAQGVDELELLTPYSGTMPFPTGDAAGFVVPKGQAPPYKLILPPQPMANQEPRSLGNDVVFDLSLSKGLSYFVNNNLPIDIMFSTRGMVVGPLSGSGIVEFVIGDREDSLKQIPLPSHAQPNPPSKRERMIVSVTPVTGKTAVHPVYVDPTGASADPYRYAETGEVAGQ